MRQGVCCTARFLKAVARWTPLRKPCESWHFRQEARIICSCHRTRQGFYRTESDVIQAFYKKTGHLILMDGSQYQPTGSAAITTALQFHLRCLIPPWPEERGPGPIPRCLYGYIADQQRFKNMLDRLGIPHDVAEAETSKSSVAGSRDQPLPKPVV
jgi:hypothetical protein